MAMTLRRYQHVFDGHPKLKLIHALPATVAAARLAPAYNTRMESGFCANCQTLQRRLRDLQAENERLRRQLDEPNRARKR